MTDSDNLILVSREGPIATVTLNNPARRNALSAPMWRALRQAFAELDAERDLRAVVVRGAGTEAFAAGADISEFAQTRATPEQARAYDELLRGALHALGGCRHPTVAMIHGACVGGGLQIATQCDIRISGASGLFGAPIKGLGLVMPSPEIEGIMGLCGPGPMLEILLEGRMMKADEACAKGLVSRVVPDDELEGETYATARRIADGAPLTARWHKAFVRGVRAPEQDEYFYFDTDDFREGVAAFLGKRKPTFRGE